MYFLTTFAYNTSMTSFLSNLYVKHFPLVLSIFYKFGLPNLFPSFCPVKSSRFCLLMYVSQSVSFISLSFVWILSSSSVLAFPFPICVENVFPPQSPSQFHQKCIDTLRKMPLIIVLDFFISFFLSLLTLHPIFLPHARLVGLSYCALRSVSSRPDLFLLFLPISGDVPIFTSLLWIFFPSLIFALFPFFFFFSWSHSASPSSFLFHSILSQCVSLSIPHHLSLSRITYLPVSTCISLSFFLSLP